MTGRLVVASLLLFISIGAKSQEEEGERAGRFSPKEFSIPPSPVFDLMGLTPSQINRTTDIRDFKVDWSFKSWKLNPNLAIQAQPVWELIYNRHDLKKYRAASGFMRRLSTLDVSIGTVQNEEGDRRIGFAAKMNLLKARDPLMEVDLYDDISLEFAEERKQTEERIKELEAQLDTTNNVLLKPALRSELAAAREQQLSHNSRRMSAINQRAAIFAAENWNAASLDIAVGRVYTYQSDSVGSLRKLRLNRNTGWGVWINGGLPLGKKWMLSGLVRSLWYEEELDFLLQDNTTQEIAEARAVAENRLYSVGLNLRYGGPVYSFFVEFLYEKKALKTAEDALKDVFVEPANTEVISSSVQWAPVHPNALTIGGDWRVGRNVVLNYGMRWTLDKNGKTQSFLPIAGISCMMR